MNHRKVILAFRFSAMGDVAMTVPVIKEFLKQNPDTEMVFVSREKFKPLFDGIDHLTFYPADLDGKHKGLPGLYRLAGELKKFKPYALADLHNVLRTKILRLFLKFRIQNISTLDKGRKERKQLLRQKNKVRKPIRRMTERYADVFRELGFQIRLPEGLTENTSLKENAVGIAPFALHEGKTYPEEKMKEAARRIAESGFKVYLFGGGEKEIQRLKEWEKLHPNIISTAGKFSLSEELNLIRSLKLMVSMDSANMHLASLVGTRVISIWGNTHPFMGFLGYGQSYDDVFQDETLLVRPTSVFGKEPKELPDIDYFSNLSAEKLVEKILQSLE